jgi:hypothetical protein
MTEQDWHDFADQECGFRTDHGETFYTFSIEDLKRFFFAVQQYRDQEARE